MKTFSFQIVLADMPREKEEKSEYQREVLSDLQRIAEDLVAEITNHRVLFGDLITVQNVSLEPFLEEFQHTLTGWTISLDLLVPYYWDACSIPAEWNDFFESSTGGPSSILTFIDSITRDENGNVSLVNDEANPSPNYYYGTNNEGVRGWYLTTDNIGLTCETIGDCQTIIDIEAAIDALEEEILLKADISSISAVGFSNDYDDLDNKPTIPDAQVNSDWNATSGVAEILNKPTLTNGTVTSVGLTMPSAFSVANSPITSSGDIAVTGAGTVSQYVRGDGSLANFPASTGGGGSLNYYLNGSVAQGTFGGVAFREMDRVPIIGAGTDFTIATNGYIQSFITDANVPNLLEIPAGNWNFETYFSSSSAGGTPSYYIELYKWNGTTLSLIASGSANPEGITNGTATHLYVSAIAVPQTTLALTDRLAVRIYVNNSGRTIKLHTENGHLCQVITTFSTGLTALNGLTAQVQNFATGTTGTDFGISSATSTHTFNLPTASAANRGALSSADWTTFNNKQAALVSGTNIKTINGNSVLGSGNISTGFQYTVVGISPPTAGQAVFNYDEEGYPYQISINYTTGDGTIIENYLASTPQAVSRLQIFDASGNYALLILNFVNSFGTYATYNVVGYSASSSFPFFFAGLAFFNFDINTPALISGTTIKTINGSSVLGSGNLVVSASPSGVAGAVQFSNGSAFSSDAANLFFDDTNNRLGIGTNAPATTLQVGGTITSQAIIPSVHTGFNIGSNSAAYGRIFSTRFAGTSVSDVTLSSTGTTTNINFQLNDGSGNVVGKFFNTTGNFTLQNGGTFTDAGYKLDVNGSVRATGSISAASLLARGTYLNQTLVATANNDVLVGLDIQSTFTTGAFTGTTSAALRVNGNIIPTNSGSSSLGTGSLPFSNGLFSGIVYSNTFQNYSSNLSFSTGGTNVARFFLTTGNFTLQNGGTFTDAGYRLDVQGNARVTGTLLAQTYRAVGTSEGLRISNDNGYLGIFNSADTTRHAFIQATSTQLILTAERPTSAIVFNSGGVVERMRLVSNGNLLVGTATDVASSKLTIESTTQGFLPPRMTTTQKNAIASPAAGLVVYDNTINDLQVYNGTSWVTKVNGVSVYQSGLAQNQYQAAAGSGNTLLFGSSYPITTSTNGNIIKINVVFQGISTINNTRLRVYAAPSFTSLSGAVSLGFFDLTAANVAAFNDTVGYEKTFRVFKDFGGNTYSIGGVEPLTSTSNNDFTPRGFSFNYIGDTTSITAPYIVITLNQGGILHTVTINYSR
jgi:hypothetical protein